MDKQGNKLKINKPRFVFGLVFLTIGILGCLYVLYTHDWLLGYESEHQPLHYFQFFWSLCSAFVGFGALAVKIRYNPKPVVLSYLIYYLPVLVAIAALITSVTLLAPQIKGPAFFYFSFSVSFALGVLVDSFFNVLVSFLQRHEKLA
jgi:hypothetical protein